MGQPILGVWNSSDDFILLMILFCIRASLWRTYCLLRLMRRLTLSSPGFISGPEGSRVFFVISCPIAQVQASGSVTRDFVPFLLVDPLKKAFKALGQGYCPAYGGTDLLLSSCCLNSCFPQHVPQPVFGTLLSKSLFLYRYRMDQW